MIFFIHFMEKDGQTFKWKTEIKGEIKVMLLPNFLEFIAKLCCINSPEMRNFVYNKDKYQFKFYFISFFHE